MIIGNPKIWKFGNEYDGIKETLVLNGLTLTLRGTISYGATYEKDELFNAGSLKVTEVTHIGSVCEKHRFWTVAGGF